MSDRARQFMPFSALKGFHELIREKERVLTEKKELSEDSARELSEKMSRVKKGMMIKVMHFSSGEYIVTEGAVTAFDITAGFITIVKNKINFDDIFDIILPEK